MSLLDSGLIALVFSDHLLALMINHQFLQSRQPLYEYLCKQICH